MNSPLKSTFADLNGNPLGDLPDASASVRGAVTTTAQTFGGTKKQIDPTLTGSPARSLLHPDVSVLDFGADPTGVSDSSAAFTAAIVSFFPNIGGSSFTSLAGTVKVPPGKVSICFERQR